MTDKVQKIKDWISKEQDGLMDAQGNFEYPEHEGAYYILCNLDAYIDSLQEEPKFKTGDRIKPIDSCLGSPRTIVDVCGSWYVTDQGTLDFEFEDNWELVEESVSRTPADIEAAMQEVEEKSRAFTEAHKWENADDILAQMRGEEPVSIWHDSNEEPDDMSHCLIFYGCKESVGHYLHYEPVLYNKKEKMFVTSSFPHPTGYKVEQKSFDGGCIAEVHKDKRDRISISDITSWCYLNDLHNLTQKEEPVSEDLEEASKEWLIPQLDKSYANYGEAKMMELTHFDGYAMLDAIEFGAQWKKEHLWKPADGDDLPEIDREVIALLDNDKVVFAHRPPEYWDGKDIVTGKVTRHYPKTYDKGGWNIPNVKYWLDVELPKEMGL